jgi:uncharacterized protein YkuJ
MTRRLERISRELAVILKARRKPGERYRRADGSLWEKPASGGKVVRVTDEPQHFPADLKTKKARELKASDWGDPEEIMEMAKTPRTVKNRYEAQQALENIISGNGRFQRTAVPLKSKSGLTAYLRRSSIGKLVSGKQEKEMPAAALWTAAANIDKLYANAIEPWRFAFNEEKENDKLKARRILYAPMEFHERIIPVMFTVKEYHNEETDRKLYALEAIDFDIVKKAKTDVIKNRVAPGTLKRPTVVKSTASYFPCDATHGVLNLKTCVSPPTSSYASSIPNIFDDVNSHLIRKRRLQMILEQLQVLKARRSPGETWRRKDGSQWTKLSSGAIVPVPEQRQTGMFGEEQAAPLAEETARKTCSLLTNVLESGKSATVRNKDLGDITVDAGHTGKGGYGLKHIIEQRHTKDGKNDVEITALFIALKNTLKSGVIIRDEKYVDTTGNDKGVYLLEKNGIIAVVSKMRFNDKEQFVLTGYENKNKEKEAADTIKKVISKYGYAPEFSSLKSQVGAVVASLAVSHKAVNKSREQAIRIIKVWLKAYKVYERERYGTAP